MSDTEEGFDVLEGEVFLQEEARTFRVRQVIGYLDQMPRYVTGVWYDNPVPVIRALDGEQLGYAYLTVDETKIVADVMLLYSTEERLLIETGDKLYARIDAEVPTATGPLCIGALTISSEPRKDSRIEPLGKPVL